MKLRSKNGKIEITMSLVHVTPELAQKWLDNGDNWRPLSLPRAQRLAGAITRGEWKFNGDTIRFDEHDKLMDGQTRLTALILAKKALDMLIVRGIKRSADSSIDTDQAVRKLDDRLKHKGYSNTRTASSITKRMDRGARKWSPNTRATTKSAPTFEELLKTFDKNEDLIVKWSARNHSMLGPYNSATCYQFCVFEREAPVLAERFFKAYSSGASLPAGDVVLQLHRRLMRRNEMKYVLTEASFVELLIEAWQAWRSGRPTKKLSRKLVKPADK